MTHENRQARSPHNRHPPQEPPGPHAGANSPTTRATTHQGAGAGLVLGEVEAWRIWRITTNKRGELRLASVTNRTIWHPSKPLQAHKLGEKRGHGVHAFKSKWASKVLCFRLIGSPVGPNYSPCNRLVWGKVLLWGRVIEFEKGYHAEYAKVASIHPFLWSANHRHVAELRRIYKV